MLRVRAPRPATKPDTRLKSQLPSPSCARGAPRMVPVFGGERFLRPSCRAPQGVAGINFKIFSRSTKYPQFSRSYPPVGPDSPQEVHRSEPAKCCAQYLSQLCRAGHGEHNLEPATNTRETGAIERKAGRNKGKSPSTHEMEGPSRSRSSDTDNSCSAPCRSTSHQAGYPLEVPVAQFLLRPGCPPDGSRFRR
jgi:hypothetical protein